jgi:pumilio RNA-binding family
LQQLFRSQNPSLTTNSTANGQLAPQPMLAQQQFLAQQAQNAAYAQQAAAAGTYMINPGQEAGPYMAPILTAQVPQYYGVAPWVYPAPANLIPQQGSQPRRPLTPSQQGAENQYVSFIFQLIFSFLIDRTYSLL